MGRCKLCGGDAELYYTGNGWLYVVCAQCGPYKSYERTPVDEKFYPLLAAHLRDIGNKNADTPFELTWDRVRSILARHPAP